MKDKIVVLLFCLIASALYAQKNGTWDYPVKPGMEAWNKLATEKERIAALQVPEDVLKNLSSEEAVRLVMTFPDFDLFVAFSSPQNDGFSVMVARYNIFRHLLSLKNMGKYLIATYKDLGLSGFKTLPYSNEAYNFKLYYLELILARKEILQSLMPDEKLELLTEARAKFSEKINNKDFSSLPCVLSSTRIMASILDIEEYQELKLSSNKQIAAQFIQTGKLGNVFLIDEIVRMTDNYINSKKQIQ